MGGGLKPRRALFWAHLALGTTAGLVVLVMSATGVALSVERPVVDFAERGLRAAPPSPDAPRLDLDALVAGARAAVPGSEPDSAVLRADSDAPVAVGFGRERTVFLNPYTGAALGGGAEGARAFFRGAENFHRWLGASAKNKALGRALTGAANAAFLLLACSGLYLWWPLRRMTLKGSGKTRDWNWHNAFGACAAPVLILITSTGLVMSYAPAAARPGDAGRAGEAKTSTSRWEALAAAARAQEPAWRSITIRLPARAGGNATAQIEEAGKFGRSTLTLDAATAAVVKWEPISGWSRERRLRTWARFAHTGEEGGLLGRLLAALAGCAGMILVWTGLSLAGRRLLGAN